MNKQSYLAAAERHCLRRGCKLTTLRRHILELVLEYDGVVKAYQVLADLQRERGVAAPPTVYRALDFLVEQGLLHKVDALNGFVVCRHFDCHHHGLILVCETCGRVEEIDASRFLGVLQEVTDAVGFQSREQNLLLTGVCKACHA
ncbi:Fur family transcriptional regulator [Pseudogulbenkiania sp. MAI-1]|uniref:Fur family transcriptional regulator n=1 Tax=Pseudogulbenkiania sp. MAI-1 TaxID=990370 RepID=UPI00045E7FAA|nr:Fur family transcriptional regulator [Pseudogulbenkiania sp. MAI-1]